MAFLEYALGSDNKEFQLDRDEITIGRDRTCTLQLLHDPELSRQHCCVRRQADGTYVLRDEKAKNGTFLNGTRVLDFEIALNDFDRIRIGNTTLTFHQEPAAGGRTEVLFDEIASKMEEGKGYHTIMREIVEPEKPSADKDTSAAPIPENGSAPESAPSEAGDKS